MKLESLIPHFSALEKLIWAFSVAGVTVLFLIVPEKNPLTLIATLFGVSALIFTAKGNVIGKFLSIIFAVFYAVVSLSFRYYGEAMTYLFMSLPADLFSAIVWLKNPSKSGKSEVRMTHLTPKKSGFALLITSVVTFVFYFILKALNTANLGISTLSVATSMIAAVFTAMRVPYYAVGYAANDIVLIALWILASVKNPVYVPMIFNFTIFLINDMYGFFNWKKLRFIQDSKEENAVKTA